MTRSTKDIDALIREALSEEQRELLGDLGELSVAELLTETFRGRHKLLAMGGFVATLAFFVLGLVATLGFLQATEPEGMIRWGAAAALCFAFVFLLKIWYWLEMARVSVVRDVKRLELQVAHLGRRLAGGDEG